MATKKPTTQQITDAVVTAGGTPEVAAAAAIAITESVANSAPDSNDYLTEFNNKIETEWVDRHSNATRYDEFKKETSSPTLQSVVFETISPIDFNWGTQVEDLTTPERVHDKKKPEVHRVLKSLNIQQRWKVTSSQNEIRKIANGEAIAVSDIVNQLGESYADARNDDFENLINSIESVPAGKAGADVINPMASLQDISNFIQDVKSKLFAFKGKRTDQYNTFTDPNNPAAKADTKLQNGTKAKLFINAPTLYKIGVDYYATLFQLKEALINDEVDIVEVSGLTDNKFAILADPRVVSWNVFLHEITSDQIPECPRGDQNHCLFSEEIMGTYNCFNRVVYRTATA